jgi:hypothetical protein
MSRPSLYGSMRWRVEVLAFASDHRLRSRAGTLLGCGDCCVSLTDAVSTSTFNAWSGRTEHRRAPWRQESASACLPSTESLSKESLID